MEFKVRVLNASQQILATRLDAVDLEDARSQVIQNGWTLLAIQPQSFFSGLTVSLGGNKKSFDLLLFAQELLALTSAGISVVEAVSALLDRATHETTKYVLQKLQSSLQRGQRLSSAFAEQPQHFPGLFVGIVQAAEGTGDLPRALERYVTYETKLQAVRHKALNAAIYPGILLSVGFVVAMFLLGYVVPRFAAVYQNNARQLSWASEVMLAWGQFAAQHTGWLMLLAVGMVIFAVVALKWLKQSGRWLAVLGLIPGVRQRIEILILTRLYLTLGMLLEGGIPIMAALQMCEAVMPPQSVDLLRQVRHDVGQGISLSVSLERHTLSTTISSRMLRVGEQTGQTAVMLGRTAAFYDTETTRWMEQFSKTFEPLLMAAIGIVIGLIVVLLYAPIFDLAGSM